MDPAFCLLLSLSIYLEEWIGNGNGRHCEYLFCSEVNANNKSIARIKVTYRNNLLSVFEETEFKDVTPPGTYQSLGSHSLRKYASTWSRQNGCTMDDIEIRGRWKTNTRRVLNRYVNVEQPLADARVQSALCVGGPMRYKLVPDSGITTQWIKIHVIPGITDYYEDDALGMVLALPLLWASLDENESRRVPHLIAERIQHQYSLIRVLEAAINPVQRILLTVYQIQEQLCIDEILPMLNERGELLQQPQQHRNQLGITTSKSTRNYNRPFQWSFCTTTTTTTTNRSCSGEIRNKDDNNGKTLRQYDVCDEQKHQQNRHPTTTNGRS